MFSWNAPLIKHAFTTFALMLVCGTQAQADAGTFQSVCAECHTGGFKGFISGAPNVNKPSSWQKYLKRDTVTKMQEIVLFSSKDHKPKGGCPTCSDQQILEALDYIMTRVK